MYIFFFQYAGFQAAQSNDVTKEGKSTKRTKNQKRKNVYIQKDIQSYAYTHF